MVRAGDMALGMPAAYLECIICSVPISSSILNFHVPFFGDFGPAWETLYINVAFLHISTKFSLYLEMLIEQQLSLLFNCSLFCIILCS